MNVALLQKLFGPESQWQGPCTVILDAQTTVQAAGGDSIAGGGTKSFAPRMVSGRVTADSVCLMPGGSALLLLQQQKIRQPTGEEIVKQVLLVADPACVVAVEFDHALPLHTLGLTVPPVRNTGSGVITRPKIS